jgi:hypothetical protein
LHLAFVVACTGCGAPVRFQASELTSFVPHAVTSS